MRAKYRHECEHCGFVAELERAGRFRDEDVYEIHLHYEQELRRERVLRHLAESRLAAARERIDQLRELVNWLPDPVSDIEFVAEEENGFI